MAKAKTPTLKKPVLSQDAVLGFAEGRTAAKSAKQSSVNARFAPPGDVRLTVNLREDVHLRLKIEAAKRRTTIGDIIEELVKANL